MIFRSILLLATLLSLFTLGCDETNSELPILPKEELDAFELSFGSEENFDFITWNIETFPKHSQSVEYAAKSLRGLRPDVVAIQEVWSISALDELTAQLEGYQSYAPADVEDTGLAWLVNTATTELLESPSQIFTDDNYDFSYRSPLVLKVRFGELEMVLINLHLKCCGDGILGADYWDEERRRLNAGQALKDYIEQYLDDKAVIVAGDWNDTIDDPEATNVFWPLLQDTAHFLFTDKSIAIGDESRWSFPYYPSHIDHILITDELFEAFEKTGSFTQTLLIEDALPGGLDEYWTYLSDHRPLGLSLVQ
ncbi:MAG: hypothetical protein HOI23_18225 [Deltaproteobacteria bacterium]|jgi:exonuclease III|nr:hypothetical protein [Deltaproteobacteria bacterium]